MSEPTWELLGGGGVIGGPIDYVGDWAAGVTYQPGQVVRYAGVDYLAVNPSLGQVPPKASPLSPGMICLYDRLLTAGAAEFDVQNISQVYAHLRLMLRARGSDPATSGGVAMRFNGDAGANYDYQTGRVYEGTASPTHAYGATYIAVSDLAAAGSPANLMTPCVIDVFDYASPSGYKVCLGQYGMQRGLTAGVPNLIAGPFYGNWRSTAAINRIQVIAPFAAGSRLTVYGMLTEGQAPPITTLAPGGIGTSFPASPTNGELFTLVDSLTAPTYAWTCRYMASITDAYKWVCVGGDAKMVRAESDHPANPALSMTVPNAGYYNLAHGAMNYVPILDTIYSVDLSIAGAGSYAYYTFRAVGSMAGYMDAGSGEHPNVLVPSAGATIAQRSNAASGTRIERRWISARPVRLS